MEHLDEWLIDYTHTHTKKKENNSKEEEKRVSLSRQRKKKKKGRTSEDTEIEKRGEKEFFFLTDFLFLHFSRYFTFPLCVFDEGERRVSLSPKTLIETSKKKKRIKEFFF